MKQKPKVKYPTGWNERRVRAVIAHYDNQTEEERVAEMGSSEWVDVPGASLVRVQSFGGGSAKPRSSPLD